MVKLQKLLIKILENIDLKSRLTLTLETAAQQTLAANGEYDLQLKISKPGYYPLGVVGRSPTWISGQTSMLNVYYLKLHEIKSGEATVRCAFKNIGTGSVTFRWNFDVLWVKEM